MKDWHIMLLRVTFPAKSNRVIPKITSSKLAVSFPASLVTSQLYCPASNCVNTLIIREELITELASEVSEMVRVELLLKISCPLLHVTVGRYIPLAKQNTVTLFPMITSVSFECVKTSAGSVTKSEFVTYRQEMETYICIHVPKT